MNFQEFEEKIRRLQQEKVAPDDGFTFDYSIAPPEGATWHFGQFAHKPVVIGVKRTNEYRAWDKHDRIMIYPEEAQDSKEVIAIGFHGLPISIDRTSFDHDRITAWNVDHRLIPMQSTGKTDKNRKKIYEGDIVLWCNGQYTITFSDIEGTWILKDDRDDWECPSLYAISSPQQSRIEVIGNIYENQAGSHD